MTKQDPSGITQEDQHAFHRQAIGVTHDHQFPMPGVFSPSQPGQFPMPIVGGEPIRLKDKDIFSGHAKPADPEILRVMQDALDRGEVKSATAKPTEENTVDGRPPEPSKPPALGWGTAPEAAPK